MSTKIAKPSETQAPVSQEQADALNLKIKADAEAQAKAESEAKAKQEAKEALAKLIGDELDRVSKAKAEFFQSLTATGSIALENIAIALGASVDKFGYPAFGIWLTFITACALKNTPHLTFDRMCRIAAQHIGSDADRRMSDAEVEKAVGKFLTKSAKGSVGGSKASLKIKNPKAWDVAVGE